MPTGGSARLPVSCAASRPKAASCRDSQKWLAATPRLSTRTRAVTDMKTLKLRTLQHPTRLEALLDSLAISQNWRPAGTSRLADISELSTVLQKLVGKAIEADGAWLAWVSFDGVRLLIAEMSLELSRERGRPALKVAYHNDAGELQEYCQWIQLADGNWQRCAF